MASTTCHSRWCPRQNPKFKLDGEPNAEYCANVTHVFQLLYPGENKLDSDIACCKLYCGQRSQLLQLRCQDVSTTVAILYWFMVLALLMFAIIHVGCILWGRGGRKVAMVGGPFFLSFITVVVYATRANRVDFWIDTPLYPIVGAMNVVAFAYYFSSFQYSISLTYELAAASALVFSMFPMWMILTVDMTNILSVETEHQGQVLGITSLVVAALVLSLLWIIHSSLYRTVGYRATWIRAMQRERVERKRTLSRLWIFAGAAGQPTWRTPVGQSIGLYLTMLSWIITVSSHNYLQHTCRDDLILFHIVLWTPPVILTIAVLATQITICIRTFLNFRANNDLLLRWFQIEYQYLRALYAPYQQYYDALVSYRLG